MKQDWDWHEISAGKGYRQRRTLGRAGLSRIHDVIVASMLVGRDHLSLEEDDKGHECQQAKEPLALNNRLGIGRGLSELSHVWFLSEFKM